MSDKVSRRPRAAACVLFLSFFWAAVAAGASAGPDEERIVHLKDGTVLRGTLVPDASGVFRIKTSSLGDVRIDPSEIVSVETGAEASAPQEGAAPKKESKEERIEALKGDIMNDQSTMATVKELAANDEVVNLMLDKDLQKAILARDFEAMRQNPNFQAFASRPDVQALVQKIRDQHPGAGTDE
ncbi:MAG: hypothetical protein ACM3L6_06135 [Deltaproteobacteria bacterium]